jgi:hypothetical protein
MGKSARVLGREFGCTAREMNELLKNHGYLDGEPGAYGLTEKGERYGDEQRHSRGTGGYAHYNRSWETRRWSDATAAALRADIETNPRDFDAGPENDEAVEREPFVDYSGDADDEPQPTWVEIAIGGAMIGALLLAPRVKPFWNDALRPAAKDLRDRFTKHEPVGLVTRDAAESSDSQRTPSGH